MPNRQERERQGVEEKRVNKGSDRINTQAKYKLIPKSRKRNSEKSQKKYEETTSPHLQCCDTIQIEVISN